MNYDRKESENVNECEAEKRMCEPKDKNESEQIWNVCVCVCAKRSQNRLRERDPYSSLSWPRALWATEWKQTAAGLKLSLNEISNNVIECKLKAEKRTVFKSKYAPEKLDSRMSMTF